MGQNCRGISFCQEFFAPRIPAGIGVCGGQPTVEEVQAGCNSSVRLALVMCWIMLVDGAFDFNLAQKSEAKGKECIAT